jgi:uncharacterized protein (DUF433 family)
MQTPLHAIEAMLPRLSLQEKAQLLEHIVFDLSGATPGIEKSPNICGGEARVANTRIPVWVLVQARRLGVSEAELLAIYPTLRAEDLAIAWRYERTHPAEIEHAIAENEGS